MWSSCSILSFKVSEFYGIPSMSVRIANTTQLQETKTLNPVAQVNRNFLSPSEKSKDRRLLALVQPFNISGLMSPTLFFGPSPSGPKMVYIGLTFQRKWGANVFVHFYGENRNISQQISTYVSLAETKSLPL